MIFRADSHQSMLKFFTRVLAVLLAHCLAATSCNLAEAAAAIQSSPAPSLAKQLTPPGKLGYVVDSYVPSSEFRVTSSINSKPETRNPKLVVLIQDLHAHYGVQKNIAGILEFLAERLPKIRGFELRVTGSELRDPPPATRNAQLTTLASAAPRNRARFSPPRTPPVRRRRR